MPYGGTADNATLRAINELDDRRWAVTESRMAPLDGPCPPANRAPLPERDREPDAFARLTREIAAKVRELFDAHYSRNAIYKATSLSRREIDQMLEQTKPPPARDPQRAMELAGRTGMHHTADRLAGDLVNLIVAGRGPEVDELRRAFLAFFNEWAALQRANHADNDDAHAVLTALTTDVEHQLSRDELNKRAEWERRCPSSHPWAPHHW